MSLAIKIENLSKAYQLGNFNTGTLSNDIQRKIALLLGREDPYLIIGEKNFREKSSKKNIVWSLKDINFELEQGKILGLIGRNGAGKSTLLKIISQITSPTQGNIKIRGRVASLLEVGTGFHPELTGRENIFLNGAILGMRKKEIENKFDEIVDFSGVERYIDTPVKRYSSGMYVRLAFAVASSLESDILIVDEVLAVGDAEFQEKCLGRMNEVSKKDGRTILFVSHNMTSIERLCNSIIILENGSNREISFDVKKEVTKYLRGENSSELSSIYINSKQEHINFKLISFFIGDHFGNIADNIQDNSFDKFICIKYECEIVEPSLEMSFFVYDEENNLIFTSSSTDLDKNLWPLNKTGENLIICEIPKRLLNEGKYKVQFFTSLYRKEWIIDPGKYDISIYFEIKGGLSNSPHWLSKRDGIIAPVLVWKKIN